METKRIFRPSLLNLFIQLAFLLLMFVVGNSVLITGESSLKFVILAVLVLVPSFIWVFFFYLQDRDEPEPVSYVVYAFLAGSISFRSWI